MNDYYYDPETQTNEFDQVERKKKGKGGKVIAFFLIFILAAVAVAGTYVFSQLNRFSDTSHTFEASFPEKAEEERPEDTGATNILLLGSDSRGGSGETENLPTVPNGGRADTMMIMHIPENGENAYLMSIMRDFWVPIPGHGEAKVNASLALGGVPLVVETVEELVSTLQKLMK